MSSYSHDAEVIVYNYKTRATESGALAGFSVNGATPDPMATEKISLREAIVSVQTSKSKSSPQGTFMITLKPTKEWTKILVPGSWCALFMSDQQLAEADLSNNCTTDDLGNIMCPLKMVGMIMAVRVQKVRDGNGAYSLTYSISGYDFGYVFSSSIYINHTFQADAIGGVIKGPLSELSFAKDREVYGNPAVNIQRILKSWSVMSEAKSIAFVSGATEQTKPPPIRMEIPEGICELLGTGKDVLQMINTVVGVDKRTGKVITSGVDGESPDFDFDLVGEKFFMIWQLIVNNTLWGMINQYLNPLLNEAYCDLHPMKASSIGGLSGIGLGGPKLQPALVVRQIPFNTPDFDKFWTAMTSEGAMPPQKYKVTNFVSLPKTILPDIKVNTYDIGYSDYERVNFVEVNAFDIDVARNSPGASNNVNKPRFESGSIRRFGLRTKVVFGADYGVVRGKVEESGYWSPLMMDWWFNGNRYANGTIECIGLLHHIAVGENVQLNQEKILGHVETVTHNFSVDENGNRMFRTNIDFSRGVSSDSTPTAFKYVYGDSTFGGDSLISTGPFMGPPKADIGQASIFEDDVKQRVSYTELRPTKKGSPSST